MTFKIPKGVFDILPYALPTEENWKDSHKWRYVESVIYQLCTLFGFEEIRTPIFESTELFTRSAGHTSDIVTKEMYTFLDKKNRSLSLRPEGTASVMRSLIENHLEVHRNEIKLFYIGPMFRYERQQAGRYRQHHQFGVESIGASSPISDLEVIHLLASFFQAIGLKKFSLLINTLGDISDRVRYKEALQNYLKPHYQELSEESKIRFEKNPLRILDSKDSKDQAILQEAPLLDAFIGKEARAHFEELLCQLSLYGLSFTLAPQLVRGLDYYNRTVFEFTTESGNAQNSLGGGGRYDGLLASLQGPSLPAVGFGCGLERIIRSLCLQEFSFPITKKPVLILPIEEGKNAALSLLKKLRQKGIPASYNFSEQKLKKRLQNADKEGFDYILLIGPDEIAKGICQLKHLPSSTSLELSLLELETKLSTLSDFDPCQPLLYFSELANQIRQTQKPT